MITSETGCESRKCDTGYTQLAEELLLTLLQGITQRIIQGINQCERDWVCNNGVQDFHSAVLIPNISRYISL